VIASADSKDVVAAAIKGDSVGTRFLPHDRQLSARKLWIAFAAEVEGTITVDDGARDAVVNRGTSLLPAGVTAVSGSFDVGATVQIVDSSGVVLARGMAAMSSSTAIASLGKRTAELSNIESVEVVHRDDLVVLAL
jgi:glutamate 5-kinase